MPRARRRDLLGKRVLGYVNWHRGRKLVHRRDILDVLTRAARAGLREAKLYFMVGLPGEGFKIAMFALDQGRYTVAAGATGLVRACRDASVKYARERRAFGVEIGQHQLVKEMIAQMESDYQAARLLWLRAGYLKNNGRRNTRETGLAKWFATVASERAAADAVQVHGANGYSDEYPVGRFYRNCKGAVIYEGTREIHKIMQADYLLGYREDRPSRCTLPPIDTSGAPKG